MPSCADLTNATIMITLLPYFSWAGQSMSIFPVPCCITLCSYDVNTAFSGLRTYALCKYKSHDRLGLPLGILVFTLSLAPIVVNAVCDIQKL